MKQLLKQKRVYLLLLYPLSLLLVLLAKLSNKWVEHFFVPFIYRPISSIFGFIVSLFPFSITEIFIVAAVIFAIYYIVKNYKAPLKLLLDFLCAGAIFLFLFEICMGLNYYRFEAKEYLGLEIKKSTKEELYNLCEILVSDMNENRQKMQTDENGVAILSDKNRAQTGKEAQKAYQKLAQDYPFLKGGNIRNKPLLSSRLFSYVMTTGLYFPYTFESNINVDVPEHTIPATMCHELTHFRGFMRENEANFLGYLACMYSDRADFKYSASLMAFEYAFPKLYSEDKDLAGKISKMLDSDILNDIREQDRYWQRFEKTVVSEVSDKVYDSYLNANGQTSGTKSYGEMLDLLLAYYRIS